MKIPKINPFANKTAHLSPLTKLVGDAKNLLDGEIARNSNIDKSKDYSFVLKDYGNKAVHYKSIPKNEMDKIWNNIDKPEKLTPKQIQTISEVVASLEKNDFAIKQGDKVITSDKSTIVDQVQKNGLYQVADLGNQVILNAEGYNIDDKRTKGGVFGENITVGDKIDPKVEQAVISGNLRAETKGEKVETEQVQKESLSEEFESQRISFKSQVENVDTDQKAKKERTKEGIEQRDYLLKGIDRLYSKEDANALKELIDKVPEKELLKALSREKLELMQDEDFKEYVETRKSQLEKIEVFLDDIEEHQEHFDLKQEQIDEDTVT